VPGLAPVPVDVAPLPAEPGVLDAPADEPPDAPVFGPVEPGPLTSLAQAANPASASAATKQVPSEDLRRVEFNIRNLIK
jgi:hypothetical protein